MRENPGAKWRGDWGGGLPLHNRLRDLGASWAPAAGSGAEPRPPTHFWHIWGTRNTSGRENSVTLL